MWQSIERKAWAMRKVKSMLELTAKEKPAALVWIGKISLGINQPRGPHDQAKPETKRQTKNTTKIAVVGSSVFERFNFKAKITPIAVCNMA